MTSTETPLLLLDVDGVLNAVCGAQPPDTWPHWKHGEAQGNNVWWPITWAPAVVSTLTELASDGLVEIQWLTTWADQANESLRELLGFPEPFKVAGAPRYGGPWWKFDVVGEMDLGHRKLIWCDDNLRWEAGATRWTKERVAPTLAISPDTKVGLTPQHLEGILEFVA